MHSTCLQGTANELHLLQTLVRVTSDRVLRTGFLFKMNKLSPSLVTAEEKEHMFYIPRNGVCLILRLAIAIFPTPVVPFAELGRVTLFKAIKAGVVFSDQVYFFRLRSSPQRLYISKWDNHGDLDASSNVVSLLWSSSVSYKGTSLFNGNRSFFRKLVFYSLLKF